MADLLKSRIAVITGAGSGIGRAIARGYGREGANVVCLDMNAAGAAETAEAIRKAGGAAASFALDVTKRDDCDAAAKKVEAEIGPVSILVNNAGITRRNPVSSEAADDDWQAIIGVNLNGVFNTTRAFLPQLRAGKGCIVNLGSVQSFLHVRTPSSTAYTASKHGVLGFTRALAAELGKDGVRVNAIGPGLIETPLNEKMRKGSAEILQTFMNHIPLGRIGQPEDIANAAIFLASDMASYMTGSIVMVDGGYRTV